MVTRRTKKLPLFLGMRIIKKFMSLMRMGQILPILAIVHRMILYRYGHLMVQKLSFIRQPNVTNITYI